MLSRYARAAQFLELTLYAVVGTWLCQRHGWPLPAVVVAALACVFASRLAIVAMSVALGHRHRSPRTAAESLTTAQWWRYFAREYRAWLQFNLVALPWDAWWLREDPRPVPGDRIPVLLVHGYFSNRGYFRHLARLIEHETGSPVFAPNFRTWFASIERFEEEIHAAIERICAGTGQPRVFVVAHSMGGLGMRAYLVRRGAARIAGLVTIAAPHQGTVLARLGSGENARQMRRGSVFLSQLERMEEMGPRVPTTCIYSPHDNLVAPQHTARLPWADCISIPGYGHLGILQAIEVGAPLLDAMRGAGLPVRN